MILNRAVSLKEHCNYEIGGKADYFFEFKNISDLKKALQEYKVIDQGLKPIFILGSGTNVLFSDHGFHGLVLKNSIKDINIKNDLITVGAGSLMEELVDFALANSLTGMEWAGGLPGTVGGAIRGNAGAFGGEIQDSITEAESYNVESLKVILRNKEECKFNYRDSVFKNGEGKDEIILSAQFELKNGEFDQIKTSTHKNIEFRKDKHPLNYPNIGSTFKNIPLDKVPQEVKFKFKSSIKNDPFPVLPVAKLIASADLVGREIGGAQISKKHPNFIVNINNATSDDILSLIKLIKTEVYKKYKINIEEEIMIL